MITKHSSRNFSRFTGALAILLAAAGSLHADEKAWTGAVDSSWVSGGNWSPSPLITEVDSVLYDSSSTGNLSQTLDQGWSITGLRVTSPSAPVTILPGAGSFVLTNTAGIDMSAATADLTILADYWPVNNGTLNVAAGRTLTLSNILATINNSTPGATAGSGTVRILGSAQGLRDQLNAITLIVDGGSVVGTPPVRLSADSGSTVTVILTNNGVLNAVRANAPRIHLGNVANTESTNHLIVNGGTVYVGGSSNSTAGGIFVGSADNTIGILDINNGTVDLSDRQASMQFSVIRIANGVNSRGTVNLNANGRLLAPRIDRIAGYAIFNFNGGYLETTTARDDYFLDVDEVNILAGGAVIDTGNRIVAAVAPLAGVGGLTKLGTGTLTLTSTSHSYAGPTTVSNGTLAISLPLSSSSLTLSSNAALNLTVGTSSNASWSPSAVTLGGSNTLTFTYGVGSQPSSPLIVASALSASGTNFINVAGTGWSVGTNRLIDYSGAISGGGIFVFGPIPVGLNARLTNDPTTTSIDLVVSTGVNTLDWYGLTAFGSTLGGLWDVATTFNWNGGASIYNEYGAGTNRLGDNVRFTPAGYNLVEITTNVRPSSVTLSNLNNTTYSFVGAGKISGPTSLIKEGGGANAALSIATMNDYAGGTFIRIGNIIVATNDALPTAGIIYLGSPNNAASLTLGGFNQTIVGLVSTGSGAGNRRVLNNSFTASILTFNVGANQTNVYAHTIGNPGVAQTDVANNFSVVKTGPGIQTFANSGYAGTTTISGGTLLFNSTATTMTGLITVQSGGTVGGNGTGLNAVGAPITVLSGGRIEPGNLGIGTFTVSNTVTLQGEALLQLNRTNATTADKLVANSISLGGTLTVTNIGDALQSGNTFTLFTGALSGNFTTLNLPALSSGLAWNTNNLSVNGTISVFALPRPSFGSPTFSGNNLILSGTGGPANGTYYVLASTNIALPLTNWTALATNTFDGSGGFSFTNAVNPAAPQQFFTLRVP
ncbi:MAG: autotransporter-associated beta strand repeat-containing protein [Verrucomicrobiota bacterium]